MKPALSVAASLFLALAAAAHAQTTPATPPAAAPAPVRSPAHTYQPTAVEQLRKEAAHLRGLVKTDDGQRFLIHTSWLPVVEMRTVHYDKAAKRALTEPQFAKLGEEEKAPFKAIPLDGQFFYYTRYGSPLAYARALDLVCQTIGGEKALRGKRIFDFGYGGIGHLRLLAGMGAFVTGVEVDPILQALYSDPADTGDIPGVGMGDDIAPRGHLTLVHGQFPADADVAEAVGEGYDLVISKNVLKNGYINPEQEVDKRMLVDLGVEQQAFVDKIAAILKPEGLFMIYNICPAQKPAGEAYIPWADGRCPFPVEMLEAAGFEIVEYNTDDSPAAREMGKALGWDQGEGAMDLENDCFAHYTLARKKKS